MALPTGPGIVGTEGASSLMKRATLAADDLLPVASRHMRQQNSGDDDSLKDAALDALKGGVKEGDSLEPVDKAVNAVGAVSGGVGMALFANDIFGRATRWAAKGAAKWKITPSGMKGGLDKFGDLVGKPSDFLDKDSKLGFSNADYIKKHNDAINRDHTLTHEQKQERQLRATTGGDMMHASFVVDSGVTTYQTLRSYSQKNRILKTIRRDMETDRQERKLGGTAGDAAPLAEATSHNRLEHLLRGTLAVGSLVFNIRGMRMANIPLPVFLVPQLANMGLDAFLGEHALIEAYTPFNEMQRRGQAKQEEYAKFLFHISKELNGNGGRGQQAAMQVGAQYLAEKATAAHMLNDMRTGLFQTRVKEALAKIPAPQAAPPKGKHVAALGSKAAPGPVVGKYTQALEQQHAPAVPGRQT